MSSTLAHYQGPASLPSDYALLSRYAGNHVEQDDRIESGDEFTDDEYVPQRPSSTSILRRASAPSPSRLRPQHSIGGMPSHPHHFSHIPIPGPIPSENTPLLNPPVPRIDESLERTTDDGNKMLIFWEELRILTRYALPVFTTHVLEFSIIMVSVVSIGHLSTTALAGITLGSMSANVSGFSIIQGFTSALDTMLPSAWTSSQPRLVGLWAQRMTVVMAALLVPVYCTWFNGETILLFLKQDPEVARLGAAYLRWVSLGLPAYAFNCISRRYFQSQGLFAIPTRIVIIVAPINVVLNYMLVWGPEKIRLGFIGAPIATAVSFNLVSLMSIYYGIYYAPHTAWHPLSSRMFTNLGVLVQLGLAGVGTSIDFSSNFRIKGSFRGVLITGQTATEWWAWELVALAASLLGPLELATQSVLLVSASTTFQAPFALAVATSVRIGNLLGEGKALRAGISSNTAIVMSLILSAASSTMFLLFRHSWAYLFNNDPEVVTLVASILPLVALFQVFDGTSAITAGILRARGKQVTGAILNLSAYYVIGLPFGMWLTFGWGMRLFGMWIGLTVSLVYCALFGTFLCLRTDWNREVWKVMKRHQEQDKARLSETDAESRPLPGL